MKNHHLIKHHSHSRSTAAKILAGVLKDKKSLRDVMPSKPDPFTQALCYGVLRYYFQLDFFLSLLTERQIKDSEVKALLLIGLYQIFFLNKPDYAAVAETVNAAKQLKKTWAVNFINGVLRNALRRSSERDLSSQKTLLEIIAAKIPELAQTNLVAYYNHPQWLIEKIQLAYPHDWQTILENNNQHPPMTLRLNTAKLSREDYLNKLKKHHINASPTSHSTYGIKLKNPMSVNEIEGFSEGFISVQDEAAQLAAPLLELSAHQIVLDACAAPGGKTTHILEIESQLKQCIAIDCDPKRLLLIQSNLDRLKLSASLINDDIKNFAQHSNHYYFDRILLDVPCSATGVIRRHPDIKLLRKNTDISQLAEEQYKILTSVWPLLKPGGILLYVTCSILPEENFLLLQKFLKNTSNAEEKLIIAKWGKKMPIGRQILPGENDMDGFYFARLKKK